MMLFWVEDFFEKIKIIFVIFTYIFLTFWLSGKQPWWFYRVLEFQNAVLEELSKYMLNLLAFNYFSWEDCENSTCVGGNCFTMPPLYLKGVHGNLFHMSKYWNCFYCQTNLNPSESNPNKILYLGILEHITHLQTDQSYFFLSNRMELPWQLNPIKTTFDRIFL